MTINRFQIACTLCAALLLSACSDEPEAPAVTEQTATTAGPGSAEHLAQVTEIEDENLKLSGENHADWITHGLSFREDRYSKLNQITPANLDQLGLAWTIDLGTKRGIQATPLVVDGIMYLTGPWSVVWAIDVRKGEIIWQYDPEVPRETVRRTCCGVVNRGAALYNGAVFVGTLDGRLVSLDAVDGSVRWVQKTVPDDSFYSITGAPRIANGKVLIGNGGAEFNVRGYVTAYDTDTGEQAWRFYTVPGDPEIEQGHSDLARAAETWTGEWWKQGGGGTVWDAIVYDAELNQVYLGVGNGAHWNRMIRSPKGGDNLYLSSIVALDADSGEYKWHFQTTPGDTWDYTATQHIVLADLEIGGASRKVLMQAPKNGFFYVIDRTNGAFISGNNFVYVNWATGLDENGRPIEAPGARYEDGKTRWITPSSHGGHNWPPMSFSHQTGLMYIPTAHMSHPYAYNPEWGYDSKEPMGARNGARISLTGKAYIEAVIDPKAPPPNTSSGRLIAWDPVKQEEVWGVDQPFHFNGGLLSTAAGLLMQGDAEANFSIRDAKDGKLLWQYDVRAGAIGSPVTYMVDGEQYVSIAVGWGGAEGMGGKRFDRIHPGTVYTWKLGGKAEPPARMPAQEKPLTELTTAADELNIGNGFNLYLNVCGVCHGGVGTGGGAIPDLGRSADGVFAIYQDIVRGGALASQGMPKLDHVLNEQEVEDIKAFILYSAQQMRAGVDPVAHLEKLAMLQAQSDQARQAAQQQ